MARDQPEIDNNGQNKWIAYSQYSEEEALHKIIQGGCSCKGREAKICKNIAVFGGTGVGKTTHLDSLLNFHMGVSIYHDWRYKLIDERERIREVIE